MVGARWSNASDSFKSVVIHLIVVKIKTNLSIIPTDCSVASHLHFKFLPKKSENILKILNVTLINFFFYWDPSSFQTENVCMHFFYHGLQERTIISFLQRSLYSKFVQIINSWKYSHNSMPSFATILS